MTFGNQYSSYRENYTSRQITANSFVFSKKYFTELISEMCEINCLMFKCCWLRNGSTVTGRMHWFEWIPRTKNIRCNNKTYEKLDNYSTITNQNLLKAPAHDYNNRSMKLRLQWTLSITHWLSSTSGYDC